MREGDGILQEQQDHHLLKLAKENTQIVSTIILHSQNLFLKSII